MSASRFASALAGRQRLAPGDAMPRHRHALGYAAVVLGGGYVEAGDEGRRRVGPGDVLVHRAFDAHLDRIAAPRGAEILNLPVPGGGALPPSLRARDPDALARAAEADPALAAAMLADAFTAGPPPLADWPDLLATALRARSDLRLAEWASRMGLAPETVSRGFRLAYGTTPARYRAELRARRAFAALRESKLSQSQGDDPGVPHAYANKRVLADLRARLGLSQDADLRGAPVPALRRAAEAALREDTRRRTAETRAHAP